MEEFVANPCEKLQFYVELPNGHADEYAADNFKEEALETVETIDGYVKIQIKTDAHPEETTIQVKDMASGEVVQTYTFDTPMHVYAEEVVLPGGCYRLSLLDAAGNGLGSGALFRFEDSSGQVLLSGNSSTAFEDELAFEVNSDGTLWEVPEQEASRVEIMPNPSDGTFYLNLGEGSWQVTVFDLMGRAVYQENQFSEGKIVLEKCEPGMYFLMVTDGAKEIVRKLMVY